MAAQVIVMATQVISTSNRYHDYKHTVTMTTKYSRYILWDASVEEFAKHLENTVGIKILTYYTTGCSMGPSSIAYLVILIPSLSE